MPRGPRNAAGGMVYHVLNRGNLRAELFHEEADYLAFERVLLQARQRTPMEIFAWCLMPNHWHLVLRPRRAGDLADFMRWLTITHTQRWRAHSHTVGQGHVYQGRYKSFPVQADRHFLMLCRYVERNALAAGLVKRAGEENGTGANAIRLAHNSAPQRALQAGAQNVASCHNGGA